MTQGSLRSLRTLFFDSKSDKTVLSIKLISKNFLYKIMTLKRYCLATLIIITLNVFLFKKTNDTNFYFLYVNKNLFNTEFKIMHHTSHLYLTINIYRVFAQFLLYLA